MRGTLYAFDPNVARAESLRVPRPPRSLVSRITDGFAMHCRVCEMVFNGLPDGGGVLSVEPPRRGVSETRRGHVPAGCSIRRTKR